LPGRSLCHLIFLFCLVADCLGQGTPRHPARKANRTVEKVSLTEVTTVQVPSLPAESLVAPLLCDPDGRIFLRLAMPDTGLRDPVLVSSDGKSVIEFSHQKINDIAEPVLFRMFLAGSELYALAGGSVPLNRELNLQTPNGKTITEQATENRMFIARFEPDGSYAGAVRLDLPFEPHQLGVFADGDFLIAGADPSTYDPRAAIVGSDGQFRRFIELKGDVHAQEEPYPASKDKDPTALPRLKAARGDSLRDIVMSSEVVQDGANILLFRDWNSPIYSISPSGDVRARRLKMGGDFRIFTIKATRSSWIVEFLRSPTQGDGEFATFAFDPESGNPLREYSFPSELGWGLACTNGEEFTFVAADRETHNLKIVKLAPAVN